MIVNRQNLDTLFTGFNASFKKGLGDAASHFAMVSMVTNSRTAEESYAWLGSLPRIREWLGERVVHNLSTHGFKIKNRTFESTVAVKRTDIEDDQFGVYGPVFEHFGRDVAEHPDDLVFKLLAQGFNSKCYDGQYFFDADHPVIDALGDVVSVSNVQEGDGPAWYLLDTSRSIRPIIYQKRLDFNLTKLDNEQDPNVFFLDEYVYGVRGRSNVGFGLWQLAFGSKAPLTSANYEAARAAMASLRGDGARVLGVRPTTLVVPAQIEGEGRRILKAQTKANGESNEWVDSAELIVTPWLDA